MTFETSQNVMPKIWFPHEDKPAIRRQYLSKLSRTTMAIPLDAPVSPSRGGEMRPHLERNYGDIGRDAVRRRAVADTLSELIS
jgi:hypothetical protein